jgi:hypothetical protein
VRELVEVAVRSREEILATGYGDSAAEIQIEAGKAVVLEAE